MTDQIKIESNLPPEIKESIEKLRHYQEYLINEYIKRLPAICQRDERKVYKAKQEAMNSPEYRHLSDEICKAMMIHSTPRIIITREDCNE